MAVMCVCVCACVCVRGCLVISPGSWTGTFEKLVSTPVQFTYLMILLLVENPGRWWEYVCAVCVCLWGGGGGLGNPSGVMDWYVCKSTFYSGPFHSPCNVTAYGGSRKVVVVVCVGDND